MKKLTRLLTGAEIALIATAVLYFTVRHRWIPLIGFAAGAVALVAVVRLVLARRRTPAGPSIGVGTVCGSCTESSADADVRHPRREFLPDELRRLLEAARHSGQVLRGLSGAARHARTDAGLASME